MATSPVWSFTTEDNNNNQYVVDFDGNFYETVIIGEQTWMKSNLKVTHYSDGTPIKLVTSDGEWSKLKESDEPAAYCYYNNNEQNIDIYGLLYNIESAYLKSGTTQGICPNGWHVPNYQDWKILRDYLDDIYGVSYSAGALKESSYDYWDYPNTNATNISGFTAVPGGLRSYSSGFLYIGQNSYFISYDNTENISFKYQKAYVMSHDTGSIGSHSVTASAGYNAYSCRCVKD